MDSVTDGHRQFARLGRPAQISVSNTGDLDIPVNRRSSQQRARCKVTKPIVRIINAPVSDLNPLTQR